VIAYWSTPGARAASRDASHDANWRALPQLKQMQRDQL